MHREKFSKEVDGINWFDAAVMNCTWTGPLLRDVLNYAGVQIPKEKWSETHVAFASTKQKCQEESWYGASIFLERAMREDAEVVLAVKVINQLTFV
jgi:sulfite oxidase